MKSGVLAVVELFAPVFDPAGPTVTYEGVVLANWEDSTELGFAAAPSDLAAVGPSFGAAHLFIDGCPNQRVGCVTPEHRLAGSIPASAFGGFD